VSSARLRPSAILRPVLLVGAALALAGGCGVGQSTQMSEQQAAVNGGSGDIGPIAIRNAALTYPEGDEHFYEAGSDAPLVLTIVNTGTSADELTSITAAAATSVAIEGDRDLPGQARLRALAEDDATDASNASDDEAGRVNITLEKLTEDVRPGRTIRVTFLFRQAGEVTVDVPIGSPDEARAESDH
jgi:copper(I)-binding protein